MTKLSRGVILGLAMSLLVAGAALAGPTRSDGDPDRPQITQPGGPEYKAMTRVSTHGQVEAARDTAVQAAPEHWRMVLRAYLSLIRVFAL
ncbi:hypothetical protein K8I85_01525 [bacterium]|nr:hypothetical protein [bacterium]